MLHPVYFTLLSPAGLPSPNPLTKPERPIIPILHTPYDYDKRF